MVESCRISKASELEVTAVSLAALVCLASRRSRSPCRSWPGPLGRQRPCRRTPGCESPVPGPILIRKNHHFQLVDFADGSSESSLQCEVRWRFVERFMLGWLICRLDHDNLFLKSCCGFQQNVGYMAQEWFCSLPAQFSRPKLWFPPPKVGIQSDGNGSDAGNGMIIDSCWDDYW